MMYSIFIKKKFRYYRHDIIEIILLKVTLKFRKPNQKILKL